MILRGPGDVNSAAMRDAVAIWLRAAALVVVWLCCASSGSASAAVAGGGEGFSGWLWWIRPEVGDEAVWVSVAAVDLAASEPSGANAAAESFWFGRPADDGKHRFRPVRKSAGRVIEQAVGASLDGRTLWACFRGDASSGGAVVSWRLMEGGLTGPGVAQVDGPRLPVGGSARALSVVDGKPWVLWRADRADAAAAVWEAAAQARLARPLPALDDATLDEDRRFVRDALLLKLPIRPTREKAGLPGTSDTSGDVADSAEAVAAPVAAVEAVEPAADRRSGRDVLLRLSRGRWEPVALPASWPDAGAAHLLALGDDRPGLLAGAGGVWTLWRPVEEGPAEGPASDGAWRAVGYELPAADEARFVSAAGQAVSVGLRPRDAVLAVLRGQEAIRVGTLDRHPALLVPADQAESAAAVGVGEAVVLLELPRVRDPLEVAELEEMPAGVLGAMTLDGQTLRDGQVLPIQTRPHGGPPPSQTVLMAVLMVSTVVMLVFWRKDPAGQSFRLPAGSEVAALNRRALAGLIDLGVGLGVAYLWSGLEPQEVLQRWPGRGEALSWSLMEPAVVAIAATVLHTAVGESLFSRSLGKALLGLRVVMQDGRDARGWRPLVRCLLKTLDLVAYLLLILLIVSPLRQRLGDVVAGTAVVSRKPAAADDFSA